MWSDKHLVLINVITLAVVLANGIQAQGQQSPCPDVFQYRYDGNEWTGYMEIRNAPLGQSIHLNVHLSLKAQLATKYVGAIELVDSRQAALQNFLHGRPIKYRVRFPLSYPIPRLTSIVYNNQVICSGQAEFGGYITSIKLEHSLYTEIASQNLGLSANNQPGYQIYTPNRQQPSQNSSPDYFDSDDNVINIITGGNPDGFYIHRPAVITTNNLNNNGNYYDNYNNNRRPTQTQQIRPTFQQPAQPQQPQQQPRPMFQQPTQTQPPPIQQQPQTQPQTTPRPTVPAGRPTYDANDEALNDICGKAVRAPAPLVVGGEYITRGDWPWIVALYIKMSGNLNFHCGGTLISKQLVITAAHCIKERVQEPYRADEVVAFLGRHNIVDWSEQGFTSREISHINIHPDYKAENLSYDSDVSILVLKEPITYTRFIRPICLWAFSTNIRDIETQVGIVVGWGRDENGAIVSPEAKKVDAPIVTEAECLRADESFRFITSNRTFCAGGRNGEGPCHGDSGGGLVLKYNNQWYLRGVVSVALADPETKSCNLQSYVVYTDVAQYKNWIVTYMTQYN